MRHKKGTTETAGHQMKQSSHALLTEFLQEREKRKQLDDWLMRKNNGQLRVRDMVTLPVSTVVK